MVLDEVLALGRAHMWLGEEDKSEACYKRAKEGFVLLLGEDSAKAVGTAFRLVRGSADEKIAEHRRLWEMEEYGEELDYYQLSLRGKDKVFGKTHPDALTTIMNIDAVYTDGFKDITKAEEMYRLALDGHEKSLGKDHDRMKMCARNLNILLEEIGRLSEKAKLEKIYPESGL